MKISDILDTKPHYRKAPFEDEVIIKVDRRMLNLFHVMVVIKETCSSREKFDGMVREVYERNGWDNCEEMELLLAEAKDRYEVEEEQKNKDKAVIDAAFKWAETFGDRSGTYFGTELSLYGAVEAHPEYKGE